MFVYELSLQICPSAPLPFEQASEEIGRFIDSALGKNRVALAYHISLEFKLYTFDLPHPLESGNIYQEGNVYTVRIRTIRQELASFFRDLRLFFVKSFRYIVRPGSRGLEGSCA